MEHVIGDVITDTATVDVPVGGMLVEIPLGVLAGLVVVAMVEVVARVVVDVVYTACITLFTSMMVSVHAVVDIDPDEPKNMSSFSAVEWTQAAPQSC